MPTHSLAQYLSPGDISFTITLIVEILALAFSNRSLLKPAGMPNFFLYVWHYIIYKSTLIDQLMLKRYNTINEGFANLAVLYICTL